MQIQSAIHAAIGAGLLAALASGCSSMTSGDSVSIGVPGLQVTALDKRTNQTPNETVITAIDGAYRETLTASGGVFIGAVERPGTYSVVVDAPGFVRWTRDNVTVARGGSCNYLQRVSQLSELQSSS